MRIYNHILMELPVKKIFFLLNVLIIFNIEAMDINYKKKHLHNSYPHTSCRYIPIRHFLDTPLVSMCQKAVFAYRLGQPVYSCNKYQGYFCDSDGNVYQKYAGLFFPIK